MSKIKNFFPVIIATGVVIAAVLLFSPTSAHAQATCTFTRDLTVGIVGEDVRCLQQYLNGEGFTVAESGDGSSGQETTLFGALTEAAVIDWQIANGVSPASGYFGSISQATYAELELGGQPVPVPPDENPLPEEQARAALQDAIDVFEAAEDAVEDNDSNDEARDLVENAEVELDIALYAFVDADYNSALENATDAQVFAQDALDMLEGDDDSDDDDEDNDEEDAEEAIEEAEDAIDEAQEEIDEASDDGEDTDEAEDLLDAAREAIDDAWDAFDDEDFDQAVEHAEDAEELADEAIDAIGEDDDDDDENTDEEDAEDALDDAESAIDDARAEIENAETDGEEVDAAWDLLDDAEEILDEAWDAFDDEDFDDAMDLAEEAENLADEAVDAIGD